MFNGDFTHLTQIAGMALAQDQAFLTLRITQRPRGRLRQHLVHALTLARHALPTRPADLTGQLLDLTQANQALEARVVQLEHQVATMVAASL